MTAGVWESSKIAIAMLSVDDDVAWMELLGNHCVSSVKVKWILDFLLFEAQTTLGM